MSNEELTNVQNEEVTTTVNNETADVSDKNSISNSEKHIKNVNVKQCVFTIIGALIGCIALLLPATFGNEFSFLYQHFPFISEAQSFDTTSTTNILYGLQALFGLDVSLLETLGSIYSIAPFIYFGILGFDLIMSIILIICRSQILRLICKILSIILAFVMLAFAILYLLYIVGFAGLFTHSIIKIENLLSSLDKSGILVALGFVVLGFTFTKKQFKWFSKLY